MQRRPYEAARIARVGHVPEVYGEGMRINYQWHARIVRVTVQLHALSRRSGRSRLSLSGRTTVASSQKDQQASGAKRRVLHGEILLVAINTKKRTQK